MNKTRVIPVLLLRNKGLVKTTKFKDPSYIGDPINSVRIFNEKEVDELVFLDIMASREQRAPDFELLADIASEAFMPMAYGGGITQMAHVQQVFALGFEKVIISSAAYAQPELIREAASMFGSQSIVGCLDVHRTLLGRYELLSHAGTRKQAVGLKEHLAALVEAGVGEILINHTDRDGTMSGYDLKLIREISSATDVPVVACGGAGGMDDFVAAVQEGGASAVAAGARFVYMGPHRAVLINYPARSEIEAHLP